MSRTVFLPIVLSAIGIIASITGCGKSTTDVSTSVDTGSTATIAEESSNTTAGESNVVPETPIEKEEVVSNYEDSVLRHAVFFKFKDESTPEEIKGVVDAFVALPTKVPEIIDFQWGTNNSPEGLDDGFTHCFLLTFADEMGRSVYLPHPAHKAFGDVLRPHMADVFVIDYWGKAGDSGIDKELKHAVFFQFKDDASAEDIEKVEEAFAALPEKIDAIKAFEWGKNNSPEKHDDGFTHCFMVTFASEKDRETYLPHPEHLKFVELLKPSLEKPRVLDFWEGE